jgi:hypothetical protein
VVKARKTKKGEKHSKKTVKCKSPGKDKKRKLPAAVEHTDHQIPGGYNIDTIVIMPVNTDTSFVYWEVTDRLLNGSRKKLKNGSAQLMVKVFEADCLKEVCSFEVRERIGKNYINYQPSFKTLIAEIGVSNGSGFVALLRSGTVSESPVNPSSTEKRGSPVSHVTRKRSAGRSERRLIDTRAVKHEIWMTKKGEWSETVNVPFSKTFAASTEIEQYYRKTASLHNSHSSFKTKIGK